MTEFTAMPSEVAQAISDVMGAIKRLAKDEKNQHAGYKFAGIDSFLELVRPECAKAGLIILQDEVGYETREASDRNGKPLSWLVMQFRFTLAHKSGATWGYQPLRTCMVQSSMGSQAFGAAQSYALKQFMRSLFQIATGEDDDADHHEQRELPPARATQPKRTTPQAVPAHDPQTGEVVDEPKHAAWCRSAEQEINALTSQKAVDEWEAKNKPTLDRLATVDPDARNRIGNIMAERWQTLSLAGAA